MALVRNGVCVCGRGQGHRPQEAEGEPDGLDLFGSLWPLCFPAVSPGCCGCRLGPFSLRIPHSKHKGGGSCRAALPQEGGGRGRSHRPLILLLSLLPLQAPPRIPCATLLWGCQSPARGCPGSSPWSTWTASPSLATTASPGGRSLWCPGGGRPRRGIPAVGSKRRSLSRPPRESSGLTWRMWEDPSARTEVSRAQSEFQPHLHPQSLSCLPHRALGLLVGGGRE